jgi:Spy/CpxP family protein refolding chaperone
MRRRHVLLLLMLAAQPLFGQRRSLADSSASPRFEFSFDYRFAFSFGPESVLGRARALALTETQRSEIEKAVRVETVRFSTTQKQLNDAQYALRSALTSTLVDEARCMQIFDRILGFESELKRQQMRLLIRTKNTLTPDQQSRLWIIRPEGR